MDLKLSDVVDASLGGCDDDWAQFSGGPGSSPG
jgi:hypothetical protein